MVQKSLPIPPPPDPRPHLGVPVGLTHPALQTDVFKELVNKFSWALGSTYRTPYGNTRTLTRQLALAMATHFLATQGYPAQIAIEGAE